MKVYKICRRINTNNCSQLTIAQEGKEDIKHTLKAFSLYNMQIITYTSGGKITFRVEPGDELYVTGKRRATF